MIQITVHLLNRDAKTQKEERLVVGSKTPTWLLPDSTKGEHVTSCSGMMIDCGPKGFRFILKTPQVLIKPGDELSVVFHSSSVVPNPRVEGRVIRIGETKFFVFKLNRQEEILRLYSCHPNNPKEWTRVFNSIVPEFQENQEKYRMAEVKFKELLRAQSIIKEIISGNSRA